MIFSEETTAHIIDEFKAVQSGLNSLLVECVKHGQASSSSLVQEHMLRGAGRRLSVLRRSLENIFTLFPIETTEPLAKDVLSDVQINLHAFVINIYGVFENWAWAFVLRHNLEADIGNRQSIGMFKPETQKHLPALLRKYLAEEETKQLYKNYLKEYRDALAHRIPLYIPPAIFTPEQTKQYNELEEEKVACITSARWKRLDEVWEEQSKVGVPCAFFLHEFSGNTTPRPIYLHPQVLCDGKGVIEFGELFLQHWHETA